MPKYRQKQKLEMMTYLSRLLAVSVLVSACGSTMRPKQLNVFIIPLWLFKKTSVTEVLQAITMHFSEFFYFFGHFLISSRGSSSSIRKKMAADSLIPANFRTFATLLLPVTSVTEGSCIGLESCTGKGYTIVTPFFATPLVLHHCYNLLQRCYSYCYIYCYILILLIISIVYKNVTVSPSKAQVAEKFTKIKKYGRN